MTKKQVAWAKRAEKEQRGRTLDDLAWQTPVGIAVQPVCAAKASRALFRKMISGHHALPLMAE